VEAQDPVRARLGDREVLLLAEPGGHLALDDAGAELAADGGGLVAAVLVDHDDLVRPAHALQAPTDPPRPAPRHHHPAAPRPRRAVSARGGPRAGEPRAGPLPRRPRTAASSRTRPTSAPTSATTLTSGVSHQPAR